MHLYFIRYLTILLTFLNNREDRETELLLKLDDFEMRDHPNKRMISHFKKMIGVTRKRIVVSKSRYNSLKIEFNGLKYGKEKGKKTNDDESTDSYLRDMDSDDEDDDDVIEIDNELNVELNFDACCSSTCRATTINLDSSESVTSAEATQVTTDI